VSSINIPATTVSQPGADPIADLCAITQQLTGVQLDTRHREMVKSRMQKRLTELHLTSLADYVVYYHSNRLAEAPRLISLLTTHHSYFFREFSHFAYLLEKGLPALVAVLKARKDKTLNVWSAACSRGQECYSLAMFLDLHLKRLDPTLQFRIVGTDVDAESVSVAKNGVYSHADLKEVPLSMLQNHWARGTGEIEAYVKAKKSLRDRCTFETANLLSLGTAPIAGVAKFDIIFCRNVFIYFNQDQIRTIVGNFIPRLHPASYFFVGISESLTQLKLPLSSAGPSIYQLKETAPAATATTATTATAAAATAAHPAVQPKLAVPVAAIAVVAAAAQAATGAVAPIRVLCVDDSASILTLLKQILSKDKGFEIVGVAKNGIEAAEQVALLKPAAMTLDIHMPEMTGIEYLRKHFKSGHPPVVMVTSVSRDNAELAGQALSLGASDYVEKPALSNLADRADEIRTKLRCAHLAQALSVKSSLVVDRAFQTQPANYDTSTTLRMVVFNLSQRARLRALFTQLSGKQPPCILLVDGAKDALPAMATVLSKEIGHPVTHLDTVPDELEPGDIYLLDLLSQTQEVINHFGSTRRCSIMVYGELSKNSCRKLLAFPDPQLLLEDLGESRATEHLKEHATDIVLPTSFAYLSDTFLNH
jgi:chemotaxis protein methyltransferase CheR